MQILRWLPASDLRVTRSSFIMEIRRSLNLCGSMFQGYRLSIPIFYFVRMWGNFSEENFTEYSWLAACSKFIILKPQLLCSALLANQTTGHPILDSSKEAHQLYVNMSMHVYLASGCLLPAPSMCMLTFGHCFWPDQSKGADSFFYSEITWPQIHRQIRRVLGSIFLSYKTD